jgi:hypothetical protein
VSSRVPIAPPELIKEGFVNVVRCGDAWTYENRTDRVVAIPWAPDLSNSTLSLPGGQTVHYPDQWTPAWEHWDFGTMPRDAEGCDGI